jgi:hypothetical protein
MSGKADMAVRLTNASDHLPPRSGGSGPQGRRGQATWALHPRVPSRLAPIPASPYFPRFAEEEQAEER